MEPTGLDLLSHPLPGGMRDLLPVEAEDQGILVSKVLRVFDVFGYQRVSLPVFEYAEVLERGLGAIEPSSILRFVEPETGEVVALRPDVTPQVARLVATRLSQRPGPARLSYRGSVLRRQHERARHDQQILQAGIELVGTSGSRQSPLASDLEVIETVTTALRGAGLDDFVVDLGHGALAHGLVSTLPQGVRSELLECLALKDGADLGRRAARWGVPRETTQALLSLLHLQGGLEVFDEARRVLPAGSAGAHVGELAALAEAVTARGLAPSLVIDLGETRTVAYYTGAMFQVLAEGPGQAVASGGRYDELYGRFGASRPAAGAAIHIDHLRWALGPGSGRAGARVLVVSESQLDSDGVQRTLRLLRAATLRATAYSAEDGPPLDYARAWRYSHLARPSSDGTLVRLSALSEDEEQSLGQMSPEQAVELLRS